MERKKPSILDDSKQISKNEKNLETPKSYVSDLAKLLRPKTDSKPEMLSDVEIYKSKGKEYEYEIPSIKLMHTPKGSESNNFSIEEENYSPLANRILRMDRLNWMKPVNQHEENGKMIKNNLKMLSGTLIKVLEDRINTTFTNQVKDDTYMGGKNYLAASLFLISKDKIFNKHFFGRFTNEKEHEKMISFMNHLLKIEYAYVEEMANSFKSDNPKSMDIQEKNKEVFEGKTNNEEEAKDEQIAKNKNEPKDRNEANDIFKAKDKDKEELDYTSKAEDKGEANKQIMFNVHPYLLEETCSNHVFQGYHLEVARSSILTKEFLRAFWNEFHFCFRQSLKNFNKNCKYFSTDIDSIYHRIYQEERISARNGELAHTECYFLLDIFGLQNHDFDLNGSFKEIEQKIIQSVTNLIVELTQEISDFKETRLVLFIDSVLKCCQKCKHLIYIIRSVFRSVLELMNIDIEFDIIFRYSQALNLKSELSVSKGINIYVKAFVWWDDFIQYLKSKNHYKGRFIEYQDSSSKKRMYSHSTYISGTGNKFKWLMNQNNLASSKTTSINLKRSEISDKKFK